MRRRLGSGYWPRRLLWLASPVAIVLPLFLGAHSIFGMDFVHAAPLLREVPHFQFEQQAQQHCPDDTVVWAITRLGVYNSSAERWYGQTGDGTFTCLQDAQKAGYHATRLAH
jgi:hypothetical protein